VPSKVYLVLWARSQAIKKPDIPQVEEWAKLILLEKEKSLIGIYLTAHPLDDYRLEIESFCSRDVFLKDLNNDIDKYKGKEFAFGGMVTARGKQLQKTETLSARLPFLIIPILSSFSFLARTM
jgi:DNA polymerase III subunit alpha